MGTPWFRFHNKRLQEVQRLGRKTVSRHQRISCTREEYKQLQGDSDAKAEAMREVAMWMKQEENKALTEVVVDVFGGSSTLFTVRRVDGELFQYIPGQKLQPIALGDSDKDNLK